MDRILLWAVQSESQWRSISAGLSPDRHRGWPPHPWQRSGGCSASTSDFDDNETEKFYDHLQNVIDQTLKKDVLVVQGDWSAKVGKDAYENRQGICRPFCNVNTKMREDSDFWSLPLLTVLCWWTLLVIIKHPEDGPGIAQVDNTTIRFITC